MIGVNILRLLIALSNQHWDNADKLNALQENERINIKIQRFPVRIPLRGIARKLQGPQLGASKIHLRRWKYIDTENKKNKKINGSNQINNFKGTDRLC